MTPDKIKKALQKHATTQRAIANKLGVTNMCVSSTVNKKMVSDRIMVAIARAIGKDKTEVFPEYYFGPKRRTTSKVIDTAA